MRARTMIGLAALAVAVVSGTWGSVSASAARAPNTFEGTCTLSGHGGLTQFVAHSTGAVSGEAVVEVDFLPYFDQATMAACQAGTLGSARYDLIARTITPLVG